MELGGYFSFIDLSLSYVSLKGEEGRKRRKRRAVSISSLWNLFAFGKKGGERKGRGPSCRADHSAFFPLLKRKKKRKREERERANAWRDHRLSRSELIRRKRRGGERGKKEREGKDISFESGGLSKKLLLREERKEKGEEREGRKPVPLV